MFSNIILPKLIIGFIKLLSFTQRLRFWDEEVVRKLKRERRGIIFAFWHGRQFILVNSHKKRGICIMTSLSKDGDLQTKILENMGYEIIRGSSSKGGARATVQMIKKIRAGHDLAFAVDGPRGPIYQAKPGVIFLAQKTGSVIVPVATAAKNKWVANNWDRYVLPKPFTATGVAYGEPIEVPKDADHDKILEELNKRLNDLTEKLDGEYA